MVQEKTKKIIINGMELCLSVFIIATVSYDFLNFMDNKLWAMILLILWSVWCLLKIDKIWRLSFN